MASRVEKDSVRDGESGKTKKVTRDKVSLSSGAKLRTAAYNSAMSTPEVRKEKTEAIKMQIENNEYHVDSHKIAEKIIAEATELFR